MIFLSIILCNKLNYSDLHPWNVQGVVSKLFSNLNIFLMWNGNSTKFHTGSKRRWTKPSVVHHLKMLVICKTNKKTFIMTKKEDEA